MNITKPIAPDTLIERALFLNDEDDHKRLCEGRQYTCTCGHDAEREKAVHDALKANNRQLQLCRDIADKVLRQAECLESYAVQAGFEAGPVPSVFHLQASHFRTYANELLVSIEGVGE